MSLPNLPIDELLAQLQDVLGVVAPYLIALGFFGAAVWAWWTIRRVALVLSQDQTLHEK